MEKKKLDTLQAGRGLAALAVLLFHTEITLENPKYLGHGALTFLKGGYIGIDFFFVLSGFVIMLAHEKDIGQPARVANFLWRRITRIYPLLWVTLAITSVLTIVVLKTVPSFWEFISEFLILPAEKTPLLTVEWTLQREMIFYVLFALAIVWRTAGFLALGLWFLLSLILPYLGTKGLAAVFFDTHHLLFGFGMGICVLYRWGLIRHSAILVSAGTVLFFTMWGILAYNYELSFSPTCRLLTGIGAALAITGFVGWEAQGKIVVPRSLVLMGEASFAIYLIHFPVISALSRLFSRVDDQAPPPMLVWAIAVVSLCVGLAYHLVIERRFNQWINKGRGDNSSPPIRSRIVPPPAIKKNA